MRAAAQTLRPCMAKYLTHHHDGYKEKRYFCLCRGYGASMPAKCYSVRQATTPCWRRHDLPHG